MSKFRENNIALIQANRRKPIDVLKNFQQIEDQRKKNLSAIDKYTDLD
jgi:hypothetical protein